MEITPQVLSEIQAGHGLGMAAAARKCNAVNPATVCRWCASGVKSARGIVVKLEHVRIGSKLVTSGPALERFILGTTATIADTIPVRSPAQRRKAAESASRELEAIGC
ncbi:hypothetical protein BH11PLA2_BH11PLA2_45920 [soil metagenome]